MKRFLMVLALLITGLSVCAQEDDYARDDRADEKPMKNNAPKKKFTDNLFLGGGLGLQFGTITSINVSPTIGYRIIPSLHTGVTFIYNYYQDNRYTPKFSTSSYGGSVFLRWVFFKGLFAHAEFETLNGEWQVQGERYFINSLFLGGGYAFAVGGNSFIAIYILFNVLENEYSPYSNPIFRFNFGIGL